MHLHVRSLRCQFEESIVQFSAAKPSPQAGKSSDRRKPTFRNALSEVVANAIERCACTGVQAEPLYRRNACGHQAFAARFFPRKARTLKKLDRKAKSAELDR